MYYILPCQGCYDRRTVELPDEGVKKWHGGALVQDAFPSVPKDVRELLISRLCSACFDKATKEI